jgi:hypothetical protein
MHKIGRWPETKRPITLNSHFLEEPFLEGLFLEISFWRDLFWRKPFLKPTPYYNDRRRVTYSC